MHDRTIEQAYSQIVMKYFKSSLFIASILVGLSFPIYADSVHKWVDENGVTHYSDEAPENATENIKLIEFPANYTSSNVETDYYSITNQWMRLHEQRLAIERIKLEKTKQTVNNQSVPPQVVVVNESNRGGFFFPAFRNRFDSKNYHADKYSGHKELRSNRSSRTASRGNARRSIDIGSRSRTAKQSIARIARSQKKSNTAALKTR